MPCETCKDFHCSYWIRPEPKEQQSISKANSHYRKTISIIVILSFINKVYIYIAIFMYLLLFGFYSEAEIFIIHDNYSLILQT